MAVRVCEQKCSPQGGRAGAGKEREKRGKERGRRGKERAARIGGRAKP